MQMVLQDAPVAGGRGWMNQEWVVVVVEYPCLLLFLV